VAHERRIIGSCSRPARGADYLRCAGDQFYLTWRSRPTRSMPEPSITRLRSQPQSCQVGFFHYLFVGIGPESVPLTAYKTKSTRLDMLSLS